MLRHTKKTLNCRPNAESDIETLAEMTNGKAYSVPDETGPDAINNPLAGETPYTDTEHNKVTSTGSLTYQPSVPMGDMELLVLQKSYHDVEQFNAYFTMDRFMGGDLKIEIDVGPASANTQIGDILMKSDTSGLLRSLNIDANGVFQYYEAMASSRWTGHIMIKVTLTSQIDFISLKVTSKPPGDTLPLRTRCWTSAGRTRSTILLLVQDIITYCAGSETVSVADGSLMYVMAEVKQGNNPVIGARVMYGEFDKY